MDGIRTQDCGNFDSGGGDEVVAELGEADDEAHGGALQVGRDLQARVLPPVIELKHVVVLAGVDSS